MIVDEGEFSEMAESLKVDPKYIVNAVLDSVKSRPWYVHRAVQKGSLGESLGVVLDRSEIAYAWDSVIKEVMGEREYVVEECEVDPLDNSWYLLAPEGDCDIDSVHLQFGSDSGETVRASVEVELAGGKLSDEAMGKIDEEIGGAMLDCMGLDFEHEYYDGIWSFFIIVHTGSDPEMPEFGQMHDLVKKIKEIARADARNQRSG